MYDQRLNKYARLLVRYSLNLQPGEELQISANALSLPLVKEVYREALRVGAHPYTQIVVDGLGEVFYKEASDKQLQHINRISKAQVEAMDAMLSIGGNANLKGLSNIPPEKMQLAQRAGSELNQRYFERIASGELKWSLCQFATQAGAQEAEMSLDEYHEFILAACRLNEDDPVAAWHGVKEKQQRICDWLSARKDFHVTGPGTDLRYSAEGRLWINCCGDNNMPDGEVFTGPVEDSVEGTISFSYPAIYMGREVQNVRLTFKGGRVVDAAADKGGEFLQSILDTDPGARSVGEAAIGTNYGIPKFTKNMLFDEKLGGTCHFAVGRSIPESKGVNESVVHWDMLCNLKEGGRYTADGEVFYENGHFTKPIAF